MTSVSPLLPPHYDGGGATYALLMSADRWIHRKVEKVRFLNDLSFETRVSVDFTLPEYASVPGDTGLAVPLALLVKQPPLESFDMLDESGAAMPVLTRTQNSFVSYSTLATAARAVLGEVPTDDLLQLIWNAVMAQDRSSDDVLQEFRRSRVRQAPTVVSNPAFEVLLADLTENFILMVELEEKLDLRRVLKFSYVGVLRRETHSPWERFTGGMAWRARAFRFDTSAVGDSESYHFELIAPEGLEIDEARIVAKSVAEEQIDHVPRAGDQRRRRRQLVHLYVSNLGRTAKGRVSASLLPPRLGLVRRAFILTLGNATLLLLGWLFFDLVEASLRQGSVDSAVAILLLVPSLISGYLARAGEHQLTSRLLFGIRITTALSGLSVFTAAVTLVVGSSQDWAYPIWTLLTTFCLILAIFATRSFFPSRKLLFAPSETDNGDTQ